LTNLYTAIKMPCEDEAFGSHPYAVDGLALMYSIGTNIASIHGINAAYSMGEMFLNTKTTMM